MSVQDVIKKSILELENFKNSFTPETILSIALALLLSLVFGLLICLVYSKFFRGVIYNRTFAITLVGMTVLTTMVTLAISTNIVISLGMVGALSIVRYRTAIKDPLDLLYLFWAITTGITVGANMYFLSLAAFLILVIMLFIMTRRSTRGQVYIVIVHYVGDIVGDALRKAMGSSKYRIKSRTIRGEVSEMALEVFVKGQNTAFVEKLRAVGGVKDVTLIQYDGEYHD